MADDTSAPRRPQRILAYMIAAAVGLSLLCFIAIVIATAATPADELTDLFSSQPWPTVIMLPYLGLPLAIILMIALVIITAIRRGRESKDARG